MYLMKSIKYKKFVLSKSAVRKLLRESVVLYRVKGSLSPPPHKIKEKEIKKYAKKFACDALIETGTFLGDMVYSQMCNFEYISSVELSQELYEKARERFNGVNRVHLYCGDSSCLLYSVIEDVPKEYKILFWLDGHYSAGITAKGDKNTPIMDELCQIFELRRDEGCILIDDARLFVGKGDYPTVDEIRNYVLNACKSLKEFKVKDDIIRIVY